MNQKLTKNIKLSFELIFFETIKNRLNTIVISNEFTKTANNTPPKDA